MNIFTNLLFSFIFLSIITYFKLPDVNEETYIQNKIILFLAMFFFSFSITIISKIKNGCKILVKDIVNDSVSKALHCTLGYSIYVDLMNMKNTKEFILNNINVEMIPTFACITIVLFLVVVKTLEIMFNDSIDASCTN